MQEMAITGLRHPARAGEVAVVHIASALGLPIRIEAEDDLDRLFPVRTLFVRVEQAQIGGEMLLIIGGQLGALRRAIFEGGGISCSGVVSALDCRLTPLTPPIQWAAENASR